MDATLTTQTIDLAQLSRQAGNDDRLARDVLRMFHEGAPGDLKKLKAATGVARREAAHLILGSARAIGAGEVAAAASAIEAGSNDIKRLDAAIDAARAFIAAYLAR
jgi:HPt (histidine-containing phosphotransfer) domain-containing protein